MYRLVTDTFLCMHNVLICVLLDSCCSLVPPAPLWPSPEASSLGNQVLQCSDSKTDTLPHMCCNRCASHAMVCCALSSVLKVLWRVLMGFVGFFGIAMCRIFYGLAVRPFVFTFVWCIKCEFIWNLCQKMPSVIHWRARFWHTMLSVCIM